MTTVTKLSDVPYKKWVSDVLMADPALAADVKKYEIDPEKVLSQELYSQLGFLQYSSALAKGQADLHRIVYGRKQLAESTAISGILAGARDVYGTKQPTRFAVLKPDNKHIEFSAFDMQFPKVDGTKVTVPIPSRVTVNVMYDETYGTYSLVSLSDYTRMSDKEFIDALKSMAKSVSMLYPEDKGRVVVVKGKIQYVNPSPRWKNKMIDGDEVVWQSNQRRVPTFHPVIRIKFYEEIAHVGGMDVPISASATLSRMKNVAPIVDVPDLNGICQYAVSQSEEPHEQARVVGDIMRDREVVVVGRVSGYDPRQDRTYVNIDIYTIIQIGGNVRVDEAEQTASPSNPVAEPAPVSEPKGAVTLVDEVKKYLEVISYVAGTPIYRLDARSIWEERYKDKMEFETFDVIFRSCIDASEQLKTNTV